MRSHHIQLASQALPAAEGRPRQVRVLAIRSVEVATADLRGGSGPAGRPSHLRLASGPRHDRLISLSASASRAREGYVSEYARSPSVSHTVNSWPLPRRPIANRT